MKRFGTAMGLLAAFVLWTLAVCFVDVQAIGPEGSRVGFAGINRFVHEWTGVHFALYTATDWLSLIPAGLCVGFAALGLTQWVRRRDIRKVDFDILALGGFYVAVLAVYLLFEEFAVNYRPVLIEGVLEASYPSSTTVLVLCVMATAMMQFRARIRNGRLRRWVLAVCAVFAAFMVIGRAVCGVHWITDIIGGVLLSAGLVTMYASLCGRKGQGFFRRI